MQNDFLDNLKISIGQDMFWWYIPTHPELKTNYFERVWPKREIKKMFKTNVFEKEQEDSDPDKKLFCIE
jgi:hypothetical protein